VQVKLNEQRNNQITVEDGGPFAQKHLTFEYYKMGERAAGEWKSLG
jgi:hypothetical protein